MEARDVPMISDLSVSEEKNSDVHCSTGPTFLTSDHCQRTEINQSDTVINTEPKTFNPSEDDCSSDTKENSTSYTPESIVADMTDLTKDSDSQNDVSDNAEVTEEPKADSKTDTSNDAEPMTFYPPLYLQRYQTVCRILRDNSISTVSSVSLLPQCPTQSRHFDNILKIIL